MIHVSQYGPIKSTSATDALPWRPADADADVGVNRRRLYGKVITVCGVLSCRVCFNVDVPAVYHAWNPT